MRVCGDGGVSRLDIFVGIGRPATDYICMFQGEEEGN